MNPPTKTLLVKIDGHNGVAFLSPDTGEKRDRLVLTVKGPTPNLQAASELDALVVVPYKDPLLVKRVKDQLRQVALALRAEDTRSAFNEDNVYVEVCVSN